MLPSSATEEVPPQKIRELFDLNFQNLFRNSSLTTKIYLCVGLFCSFLGGLTFPLLLLLMAELSVSLFGGNTSFEDMEDSLSFLINLMLGLAALSFLTHGIGAFSMEYICALQCEVFRQEFYKRTIKQDMAWYDTIDSGTICTRMEEDLTLIREAIGVKLGQLVTFASIFICAIIIALTRGPALTGIMVCAYVYMLSAMLYASISLMRSVKQAQKAYEKAGSVAEEATLLIRMVRAYEIGKKMESLFYSYLKKSEWITIKNFTHASIGFGLLMAGMFFMYSWGIFWASEILPGDFEEHQRDESIPYNPAETLSVLMITTVASFMLGQIAPHVLAVSKGVQAAKDLFEIMDRKPLIDVDDTDGLKDVPISGSVEFRNVEFSYTSSKANVFGNMSFSVNAGETVAIVGPSGIGKSTIANLLQRYYDVNSGEIFLDGRNVKEYNLNFLRENFGVISQQPRLFSLSIQDNIKFGRNEPSTFEEVKRAAKLAYAHDFIKMFPSNYDTLVGEGGSQLSGGQKQRIAIARALLRNPKIFILDEATAALDVESERLVHQAFDFLMDNRAHTTFIIAHRLSTVRKADKILVLGSVNNLTEVIEQGTHEELMQNENGEYYRMMNVQTGEALFQNEEQAIWKKKSTVLERDVTTMSLREMEKFTLNSEPTFLQKLKAYFRKKNFKEIAIRRQIYSIIKSEWFWWSGSMIFSVGVGTSFPFLAIFLTRFMGTISNPEDADWLFTETRKISLYLMLCGLGTFVVVFCQWICVSFTSAKFMTKMRAFIFGRLLTFSIPFYDDPLNSVGTISSILSSDVRYVDGGYAVNYPVILQATSTCVIAFGYSFSIDAKFAGIMMAVFCALIPSVIVRGKRQKPSKAKLSDVNDSQSSAFLLHESLIGITSVTSYGLHKQLYDRYCVLLEQEYKNERFNAWMYGLAIGISSGGAFAMNALAMYLAAEGIREGRFTSDQILRAIFMIIYATRGLNQVSVFSSDRKKATESEQRIGELLHDPYSSCDTNSGKVLEKFNGKISVKNLKFEYPGRAMQVYDRVSFDVQPGEVVALVGESGCGKSTIVHLLEKFYDYGSNDLALALSSDGLGDGAEGESDDFEEERSISIDGVPIAEINSFSLRSRIGYVSQDPSLFNTTVKENIKMGKLDATDEEVIVAAKVANAHEFIEGFPDKYDTPVGRLGSRLSGGQKQRIALARAIIRNPELLLLDEATSALDAEGEKVVQEALDEILKQRNRTTFVIAHRLSTIKNSDKIIVLERGKDVTIGSHVAEIGTHEELLAKNGVYKKMVDLAWS